tara:strand:- start:359 stop:1009 length:651 start_codon:yes stop_codon:yes gene_type:complete
MKDGIESGIVYLAAAPLPGLYKIGYTSLSEFKRRKRYLEKNGYSNVNALTVILAVEVEDAAGKERLLHQKFYNQRCSTTEFFSSRTLEVMVEALLSLGGKVFYKADGINIPAAETASAEPEHSQHPHIQPNRFNFQDVGLNLGEKIAFKEDPHITATVVGVDKVMYEGKNWSLSGLTKELKNRKGTGYPSGRYQGSRYWKYQGTRLSKLPHKTATT